MMTDIYSKLAAANLNLLVVFDAVMRERNVTRAAERLRISQSAVSNALARLRHALGDELFVRKAQGVIPTPRAVELATPIRDIVERVHRVLSPEQFVPATADRTFTLVLNDHGAATLLPPLAERLRRQAPGVGIRTVPRVSDAKSWKTDRLSPSASVSLPVTFSRIVSPTATVALSSTTFVANTMAGLMLRLVRNFRPGEFVRVGDHFGSVVRSRVIV